MCGALRALAADVELFVVDSVSKLPPAGGPASRVAGDAVRRLPVFEVNADCYYGLGLDREVQRIGDSERAVGNGDGFTAGEGDLLQRLGLDLVDACRGIGRQSNGDSGDGEIGDAECVGNLQANLGGAYGGVNALAEGCIDEDGPGLVLPRKSAS